MWICPRKTGFSFPTLTSDNLPNIFPVTSNLTIFQYTNRIMITLGKSSVGARRGTEEEGMVDNQNSLHALNESLSLKG